MVFALVRLCCLLQMSKDFSHNFGELLIFTLTDLLTYCIDHNFAFVRMFYCVDA